MTAACLRPEDYLGCQAADTHCIKKINRDGEEVKKVRSVLPAECKNRESLHASKNGVAVNHTKDDVVADGYAVMIVVGRPLMRKLLANRREEEQRKEKEKGGPNVSKRVNDIGRKYRLTDKLCPFTEDGQAYDRAKLFDMYKYVGMRALGIPFFGPNVLRTVHVTKVVRHCLLKGIDPDHPDVVRLIALARHGEDERMKTYNLMKAEVVELGGNSFGYVNRGINSTSGASSESSEQATGELSKIPGMEDFGQMDAPEYDFQLPTQILPVANGVSESLLRMLEESHRRELEMKNREIAELKRKRENSECKPSVGTGGEQERKPCLGAGGRQVKKQKKIEELTPKQRKRCDLIREMHPIFVRVAREVWSKGPNNRFVMIDGKQKNSVSHLLTKARRTPTPLLEDHVKEKFMSVEPTFCRKFYEEFPINAKSKSKLRYPLDLDPSCWPEWIEDGVEC